MRNIQGTWESRRGEQWTLPGAVRKGFNPEEGFFEMRHRELGQSRVVAGCVACAGVWLM